MTATLSQPSVPATAPAGRLGQHAESPDLREFRAGLVRFTSSDLHKMWEAGILYEDSTIELLDGLLVYRDCGHDHGTVGVPSSEHNFVTGAIGDTAPRLTSSGHFLRVGITLSVSDAYEPIPDAMVLRGRPADYRGRQAAPVDVLCLIEVSDSSYARDSGPKLISYARAGVPQYVIIDLRRRVAEVYAEPDRAAGTYPPPTVVAADGSLPLRVGDGQTVHVPLSDLLP